MFQVDFAPDAMCQLERAVLQRLDYGGRQEAGNFLRALEDCIVSLGKNPLDGGMYMNEIPKRYRTKNITPRQLLIYQVDEPASCVKVDGLIEISN